MRRTGKFYPSRMNMYVPAMGYSVDVIHGAPHEVRFGPMAAGDADNILDGQDIGSAGSTTTLLQYNTDPVVEAYAAEFPNGPGFGRCLQYVSTAGSTGTCTVRGKDYLGQPMTETVTLNEATPVIGTKAFKWIDEISWSGTAGDTLDVGTTDKLGLPYRMQNVFAEQLDGVRVATLGTLVTPSLVDPQTAVTTDPRGTYDPQSSLNGTAYLTAYFLPNADVNANGNGGLYGLPHYSA